MLSNDVAKMTHEELAQTLDDDKVKIYVPELIGLMDTVRIARHLDEAAARLRRLAKLEAKNAE